MDDFLHLENCFVFFLCEVEEDEEVWGVRARQSAPKHAVSKWSVSAEASASAI